MRALSAVAALAATPLLVASLACGRRDRQSPDEIRAQIQALERAGSGRSSPWPSTTSAW